MNRPAMQTKRASATKAAEVRGRANTERREFGTRQAHRPMMLELYRRAEAQLRRQPKTEKPKSSLPQAGGDLQRMLHEQQVHQVELEMQNEELRKARDEMEAGLEKYSDLYDFAPVGYLTLDPEGHIREANLAAASLLRAARAALVRQRLGSFVSPADRLVFAAFLKQVFKSGVREECAVRLLLEGNRPVDVRMRANISDSGQACRMAVTDLTAQKLAEERVRVSEIRYRRLFEAAHDGVLLLDPRTRKITDANPFMTKLLGYSHDQLVGKELFEIGLLKDEAASQEMFRKLRKTHEVRYEDLPLESKAGRHQEVEVVANLYEEDGCAVIQCNIRDITERKAAEQELAEKARLLDLSHDAIIVRDMKGRIHYWNHGAEELYGWSRKEALGKVSNILLKTEFPIPLKEMTEELHRTDRWIGELVHTNRDGRRITVLARKTLDRDSRGHPMAVLENITDFTERKEAEYALRRNEALFSSLIEEAPVGVYVVDSKFRMQQVNRKARPVFKKVHPLLGRGFSEVVHQLWPGRVADQIAKRFRHTLKTGKPYQSPEFTARRQDIGMKEIYEWQIQRVTLPAGEFGVVCFFNDITERKRAEETQRRVEVLGASNKKLENEILRRKGVESTLRKSEQHQSLLLKQSRQMQEQLRRLSRQVLQAQEEERKEISRELHDVIAQTLTGINIRLAALKVGAALDTRGLDRNIARTQRLVEKSVDIVHQFARELRPAVLDDLGLIPALHSFMKSFAIRTGLRARLTAFAGVDQLDGSKRTALFRVAQEALTNVARHARASRVEISLQKLPNCISMRINDDGKSFRVEHTLHANGGKRLGLLGMRERVEMVGGTFTVESAPGKGTTIEAKIPIGKDRTQGGGESSLMKSSETKP